ncbi:hypothetical protein [Agrobacterium cavarae]|uniref:hypothetical protein n=1 Tax=Agrobacterium cavarae TaxID=2528239 RepID=UPI003EE51614
MRPVSAAFAPNILFNCCTDLKEPDWSVFANLELGGCIDAAEDGSNDTMIEGGKSRYEAQFFTVYGRLIAGGCEAITDCVSFDEAECIAAQLCERSSLTLEVVC